jgi:hypothetical protein
LQNILTAAELRAKHAAAVVAVKTALPPGDPKRLAMLARCDALAQTIRGIETANPERTK